MKTVHIPDRIAERVEAAGADLDSFVLDAVEEKLLHPNVLAARTLSELMSSGWVPPTVVGSQRADGRAWSEIEAPVDPS
jgi:hypothetical protein